MAKEKGNGASGSRHFNKGGLLEKPPWGYMRGGIGLVYGKLFSKLVFWKVLMGEVFGRIDKGLIAAETQSFVLGMDGSYKPSQSILCLTFIHRGVGS